MESSGRGSGGTRPGDTRQIQTTRKDGASQESHGPTPLPITSYLISDDGDNICQIRINDGGSQQQYANVQLEGVPAKGITDTGADITIVGGDLFRRVATVARLSKSQLKKPDKVPRTYDKRPFVLDGKMNLDIGYGGVTMRTPVYIKMDAPEQLLLAEGACHQLKIITYHPDVSGNAGEHTPKKQRRTDVQPETIATARDTRIRREKQDCECVTSEVAVMTDPTSDYLTTPDQGGTSEATPEDRPTYSAGTEDSQTQTQRDEGPLCKQHIRGSTGSVADETRGDSIIPDKRRTKATATQTAEDSQTQTQRDEGPLCKQIMRGSTGSVADETRGDSIIPDKRRTKATATQTAEDSQTQTSRDKGPLCKQDMRKSTSSVADETRNDSIIPDKQGMKATAMQTAEEDSEGDAIVPMVRVRLLKSLRILPHQSIVARVMVEDDRLRQDPLLLLHNQDLEKTTGVQVGDVLIQPDLGGSSQVVMTNTSGFTQRLEKEDVLGEAVEVKLVQASTPDTDAPRAFIVNTESLVDSMAGEGTCERRKKLREALIEPDLPDSEKSTLLEFLSKHHNVFSLEEGERGETDLVEMEIDTGDRHPKKHAVRRMPYTVRQEIARLLSEMQRNRVIQPSNSPWTSPVVLVNKRDGTHRFWVDRVWLLTL